MEVKEPIGLEYEERRKIACAQKQKDMGIEWIRYRNVDNMMVLWH